MACLNDQDFTRILSCLAQLTFQFSEISAVGYHLTAIDGDKLAVWVRPIYAGFQLAEGRLV